MCAAEVESRTRGSRPRTALPRTDPLEAKPGMLEAKDKDQGHRRKCSPKKKALQKNFSGDILKRKTKKVFANFPQGFWRFLT